MQDKSIPFSRWRVRLVGDEATLCELQKAYSQSAVVRFFKGIQDHDKDQWFIESPDFNTIDQHLEVQKMAALLMLIVRSACKTAGQSCTLELDGAAYELNKDGFVSWYLHHTSVINVQTVFAYQINDGPLIQDTPLYGTANFLELAMNHERVRRVFLFLDRKLTFAELYKIYEVIRENGWKGLKRYDKEVNRFAYSANNFSATGEDARHGVVQKLAKDMQPMSLSEADSFIRGLVRDWLNDKLTAQGSTTS